MLLAARAWLRASLTPLEHAFDAGDFKTFKNNKNDSWSESLPPKLVRKTLKEATPDPHSVAYKLVSDREGPTYGGRAEH